MLIEQLVAFRDGQAAIQGLEAYKVLQYPTIEAIAKVLPTSLEELGKIKGIGPMKLKKYGNAILALVESYQVHKVESNNTKVILSEAKNLHPSPLAQDDDVSSDDKQTVSVAEYLEYLNLVFQKTADVKIKGEVSAPKQYPSGTYFSLKDTTGESVLSCFIPTFTQRGLGFALEEGMEICIEGMPRMVKRNGRFLFTVEAVALVGEGAFKKAYDQLKVKLAHEGLFDRKRVLPSFIKRVGVVTSTRGAVIHDFKTNIAQLGMQIFVYDVRVEGQQAVPQILRALTYFSSHDVDVVVVMRGGGSLEDLQAFNNEAVVRTIFGLKIPTVVAIGHDTDVPLAQLVADCAVSTPTQAAHIVSGSWDSLTTNLPLYQEQLLSNFGFVLEQYRGITNSFAQRLAHLFSRIVQRYEGYMLVLSQATKEYTLHIAQIQEALRRATQTLLASAEQYIEYSKNILVQTEKVLAQANPERNLALGYSIVRNSQRKVVRSATEVRAGDAISLQFVDGTADGIINNTNTL